MADVPALLTVDEVARMLRVTPYTVRAWIKDRKLRAVKLGPANNALWRISRGDLADFLRSRINTNQ